MELAFRILLGLFVCGNLFAGYQLWVNPETFVEKFPGLTPAVMFWFRWIPWCNLVGLSGLWFWQPWAVVVTIVFGLLVIVADIALGIRYHLWVAIPSLVLLVLGIWANGQRFWPVSSPLDPT